VAAFDFDRARAVAAWPLAEVLIAYVDLLQTDALHGYRHEMTVWAATAPHVKRSPKAPQLPGILREQHGR
jgi:hypothetical protein